MTLKTYIKKLQKLETKYPKAKVVYAADEEGNAFRNVLFDPVAGHFSDGEFSNDTGLEEGEKINAICIN